MYNKTQYQCYHNDIQQRQASKRIGSRVAKL